MKLFFLVVVIFLSFALAGFILGKIGQFFRAILGDGEGKSIERQAREFQRKYNLPEPDMDDEDREYLGDVVALWGGSRTIEFAYHGREHGNTQRKVDVTQIWWAPNGKLYLHGYCHARMDKRTFLVDNIKSNIAGRSGQPQDKKKWLDSLLPISVDQLTS